MQRFKTFDGTGVAPNGRLYPVDLNTMQDLAAALHDLSQVVGVGQLSIGEDGLALVRYGAGIARLEGGLRIDNLLTAGGIQPANLTQTQRDAIAAGFAPKGTGVYNTTKNRWEFNSGDDTTRVWNSFGTDVSTGWVDAADETWTYVSYSAPNGIFNVTGNVMGKYWPGMKVKFTQSSSVRYGIIVSVGTFAAGVTPITIYTGTDYSLANAAITAQAYSFGKHPYGFPSQASKWTVEATVSTVNSHASPANGTFYNQGGVSITVPIGIWDLFAEFEVESDLNGSAPIAVDLYGNLSTVAGGTTDASGRTDGILFSNQNGASVRKMMTIPHKEVVATVATTYYANIMVSQSTGSASTVKLKGDNRIVKLRARSAWI